MYHRGRADEKNAERENQGGRRTSRAAAVMVGIVNRSNPEFTAHVTVSEVDGEEEEDDEELFFFYRSLLHAKVHSPPKGRRPLSCILVSQLLREKERYGCRCMHSRY